MMVDKTLMGRDGICGNADHLSACRRIFLPVIAQRTHLSRAHGSFVPRIKQQHHDLSLMIGQTPVMSLVVFERKVRRRRASIQLWILHGGGTHASGVLL